MNAPTIEDLKITLERYRKVFNVQDDHVTRAFEKSIEFLERKEKGEL